MSRLLRAAPPTPTPWPKVSPAGLARRLSGRAFLLLPLLGVCACAHNAQGYQVRDAVDGTRFDEIASIAVMPADVELDGDDTGYAKRKLESDIEKQIRKRGYRVVEGEASLEIQTSFDDAVRDGKTPVWQFPADAVRQIAQNRAADALLVSRLRRHRVKKSWWNTSCWTLLCSSPSVDPEVASVDSMGPVFSPMGFGICIPVPPGGSNISYELSLALVDGKNGRLIWTTNGRTVPEDYLPIPGMVAAMIRKLPPQGHAAPLGEQPERRALNSSSQPSVPESPIDIPLDASVLVDRTDGRTYIGTLVAKSADEITIETDDGKRVEIPAREILRISAFRR